MLLVVEFSSCVLASWFIPFSLLWCKLQLFLKIKVLLESKMALFCGCCFFTEGLAQRQWRGRCPAAKKWPVSPHFPPASAPLLCSHFISWKSCLYMIMPLLPFFPEPSPVTSWKQPLSSLPITSVFPRFNDYLSSHATYAATSDIITPSLTDFHDMAFRILLSGFSFTGHCFSISFRTCFWLASPWTFINTYAHSISGQL